MKIRTLSSYKGSCSGNFLRLESVRTLFTLNGIRTGGLGRFFSRGTSDDCTKAFGTGPASLEQPLTMDSLRTLFQAEHVPCDTFDFILMTRSFTKILDFALTLFMVECNVPWICLISLGVTPLGNFFQAHRLRPPPIHRRLRLFLWILTLRWAVYLAVAFTICHSTLILWLPSVVEVILNWSSWAVPLAIINLYVISIFSSMWNASCARTLA